jgi:hypothetical protein
MTSILDRPLAVLRQPAQFGIPLAQDPIRWLAEQARQAPALQAALSAEIRALLIERPPTEDAVERLSAGLELAKQLKLAELEAPLRDALASGRLRGCSDLHARALDTADFIAPLNPLEIWNVELPYAACAPLAFALVRDGLLHDVHRIIVDVARLGFLKVALATIQHMHLDRAMDVFQECARQIGKANDPVVRSEFESALDALPVLGHRRLPLRAEALGQGPFRARVSVALLPPFDRLTRGIEAELSLAGFEVAPALGGRLDVLIVGGGDHDPTVSFDAELKQAQRELTPTLVLLSGRQSFRPTDRLTVLHLVPEEDEPRHLIDLICDRVGRMIVPGLGTSTWTAPSGAWHTDEYLDLAGRRRDPV